MGGGREKEVNGKSSSTDASLQKPKGKPNVQNGDSEKGRKPSVDDLVEPPDGGWGWVVVFSSFLIHVIADGIVYSFGIFYMEFLDYYKGGKGETAWVGSLVPGVTLSVGPVASILTNRYGCRATTIAGAIIAALGFILSLLSPNLYFLYFSFGIMSGLGFGLIYLPAIVSVGYYFEKRRAFATGLAVCGSGLGAFIFNPLSKYLIDEYGWRGAILIEAGIILNCVLCGILFRPLEGPKRSSSKEDVRSKTSNFEKVKDAIEMEFDVSGDTSKHTSPNGSPAILISQPSSPTHETSEFMNGHMKTRNVETSPFLFKSDGALHMTNRKHLPISPLALDAPPRPQHLQRLLSDDSSHRSRRNNHLVPGGIYQTGSLLNLNVGRSHPALYFASMTSLPDVAPEFKKRLCCCKVSPDLYYSLKQMCDLSLLKDPIFLMFVISNFFTSIGFNMPFIFLTDRAVDEGIAGEDAKWLVSAIGISNTLGRVLFGYLADKKGVNRLMLYNSALTICGVATALCPLCSNYPLLMLYACVFGLFIGVYVSLTSVVLVDLLGLEMLTNSFGLLLMFQGIATLIGPPIAGWLYDATGSYDVSFIVAGVIVAVSGVMLYFIPLVRKCLNIEKSKSTDDAETLEDNQQTA